MAKTQIKSTSDTTKIPKPYKVLGSEIGARSPLGSAPTADSTKMKMKYNRDVVRPATIKRNTERIKEGKKQISKVGGSALSASIGLSKKGKSFKEAPLKLVKKKSTVKTK